MPDALELIMVMPDDDFQEFVHWHAGSLLLDNLSPSTAHCALNKITKATNGLVFQEDDPDHQDMLQRVTIEWAKVQQRLPAGVDCAKSKDLRALLLAALPAARDPRSQSHRNLFVAKLRPFVNLRLEVLKFMEGRI